MDPLRILQVVRPSAGGIRTHVRTLTRELAARGHHVAVAAPSEFELNVEGVQQISLDIGSRAHPIRDLRAAAAVAAASRDFDLVHGHGLRGAWIAALACGKMFGSRKPFVFTAHNLISDTPGALTRFSLRYILRKASAAICVSNAVAEGLRRFAPTTTRPEVIPNGIDIAIFEGPRDKPAVAAALGLPAETAAEGALWVVAVGRLSPEKGFDLLPDVATRLIARLPSVYFVLAGTGPQQDEILTRVHAANLEGRFFLPGFFEDIPALLRAADLVVIPSREEGQGIVALEAMAAGTPVIAARVGGLPETVGNSGVLVEALTAEALSGACCTLLSSPEQRYELAERGSHRVKSLYDADRMVDGVIKVYLRSTA